MDAFFQNPSIKEINTWPYQENALTTIKLFVSTAVQLYLLTCFGVLPGITSDSVAQSVVPTAVRVAITPIRKPLKKP